MGKTTDQMCLFPGAQLVEHTHAPPRRQNLKALLGRDKNLIQALISADNIQQIPMGAKPQGGANIAGPGIFVDDQHIFTIERKNRRKVDDSSRLASARST